jgi:hypothetical protein
MQRLDDRILEHLAETDWASPRTMALDAAFEETSEMPIRDRCRLLRHAELIDAIVEDSEMYAITGPGKRYLKGEYDVDWFPLPGSAMRVLYG